MHRSFHIALPPERTDSVLDSLDAQPGVVTVAVHRGASHKPPGDIVTVQARARNADDVLAVALGEDHAEASVTVSEVTSIADREQAGTLRDDRDDAPWEDVETALRHHSVITGNYLALMLIGGAIGALALVSSSALQAVCLVAAAGVAPAFEPLARVPLAVVLGHRRPLLEALRSAAAGYVAVVLGGVLMMLVLEALLPQAGEQFAANKQTKAFADPPAKELLLSACGALAGGVMIVAYRLALLIGPVVALHLVPATAMVGMAAVSGNGELVGPALVRVGIDAALVGVGCGLVFAVKRLTIMGRVPAA